VQPEPDLTDGVVRLRTWSDADLDCIRATVEDHRIRRGTTVPAVVTPASGRAFFERQHDRLRLGKGMSLAVADGATDEALGCAVLMLRERPGVAGIGYWILPRARRRGLATRSVRLMSEWALCKTGLERVEAWVEPANVASRRVLAAVGFREVALLPSSLSFEDGPADALLLAKETG